MRSCVLSRTWGGREEASGKRDELAVKVKRERCGPGSRRKRDEFRGIEEGPATALW